MKQIAQQFERLRDRIDKLEKDLHVETVCRMQLEDLMDRKLSKLGEQKSPEEKIAEVKTWVRLVNSNMEGLIRRLDEQSVEISFLKHQINALIRKDTK